MKLLDSLIRLAQNKPRKAKEKNPYADVLSRAVAWSIDLMLLYTLLQSVFDRLALKIFRYDDIYTIDAIKRANFNGLVNDGINAWNGAQPSLFLQSAHLHLYLFEVFVELLVIGFVVVGVQWMWGNTPGKWLIGIKIVRRKSFVAPERWRYVLRFLAYIPAVAPLMLGVIWCHFNKERRGWHDMIAGTVVITTRDADWYWAQTKRGYKWLKAKF